MKRNVRAAKAHANRALLLLVLLQTRTAEAEQAAVDAMATMREVSPQGHVRLWVDPRVTLSSNERLRADLEAGLKDARSRVTLSTTETRGPEDTSVSVRKGPESIVFVSVSMGSERRATREVDLSGVPKDGHELTIAVIADELIQALDENTPESLPGESSLEEPVPAPKAAASPGRPAEAEGSRGRWRILVGATGSTFSGGSHWLGGAIALGWEHQRILVDGQMGFERSLDAEFSQGSVQGELWSGELGLSFDLLAQPRFSLGPRCALRAGALTFRGEPLDDAQGQTVGGPLVVPRLGVDLGYRSGSLRVLARLGLGAALASVIASVDGESVLGASGLEGWFGLMAGGAF